MGMHSTYTATHYKDLNIDWQARPKAAYCLPWLISARRRIRMAISALSSSVR
jgi:hypothetical protein